MMNCMLFSEQLCETGLDPILKLIDVKFFQIVPHRESMFSTTAVIKKKKDHCVKKK